jgi:hypothetical protein
VAFSRTCRLCARPRAFAIPILPLLALPQCVSTSPYGKLSSDVLSAVYMNLGTIDVRRGR